MGSGKRRILFIYKDFSQFVRKDYETLNRTCSVLKIRSPFGKSPISFFSAGFRQFICLFWYIWRCDIIYCWFADYHSFLPALFSKIAGKRFYLVLGGYDVTHIKDLNYGSFNRKFRGNCARYSMRHATLNLPVAQSLSEEATARAGAIRIKVLPTGYDPELYLPGMQKENLILTISLTSTFQRYMVKGLDRFVELAREMPDFQFVMIGMDESAKDLVESKPANLIILPPSEHPELLEWYGKARFYAQFSRSEGLPNSVCEAMLRNCIPVGLRTGGIPEAIGDAGIIQDHWDAIQISERIRSCPNLDQLGNLAREHIIRSFHYRKRETELIHLCR